MTAHQELIDNHPVLLALGTLSHGPMFLPVLYVVLCRENSNGLIVLSVFLKWVIIIRGLDSAMRLRAFAYSRVIIMLYLLSLLLSLYSDHYR